MPDGHDYEVEVGGKTYELHSEKPLDTAAIQGVVAKFKKQAAAPSRPAVSKTDKKPAESATSQFALSGPTSIGPQRKEPEPNILQKGMAALGHILGLPSGMAASAAMQPIAGKSLTGALSGAHPPRTTPNASALDKKRFAELQKMNIFQRANELSGQSFADPNLGRPHAQGLEQDITKAQFGHGARPMADLQHMATDPLMVVAPGHPAAAAAFATQAAAGAVDASARFLKTHDPDDAIEAATSLAMAHAAGRHAKSGFAERSAKATPDLANAAAKDPLVAEKPTTRKPTPKPKEDPVAKREREKIRTAAVKPPTKAAEPPPAKPEGKSPPAKPKAKAVVAEPPKTKRAAPEPSKSFLDFIDKHPKGKVYTKVSDLYQAYKMEHPKTSREEFGQMLQHVAESDAHEIVTPSGNLKDSSVFTFKDSTGIERRVAGVRPRSAKDTALLAKGPQELGTFNPLRAVLGDDRYEAANEKLTDLYRGTAATINPYSLDPTAQKGALILREHMARQAKSAVERVHNLRFVRNAFDRIAAKTPGVAARFMFDMQGGNKHADPAAQKYGDVFRKALDDKTAEVQVLGTGALDFYQEHYFPQEWKNPAKATRMFGEGRTPFEGSKKFLHKKKIPTVEQGMFPQGTPGNLDKMSMKEIKAEVKKQGGLEPWSYNPAEMVQHKLQEMDKYIMAQKTAAEYKSTGLAKSNMKFKSEQDARIAAGQPAGHMIPDGWVPLNDKMFKIIEYRKTAGGGTEEVQHGQWYAPEGAARIINNHLSPGFANHPTMGPGYRALRSGANSLVQAKLGLSGFHWTGESINAMFSGGAKAMQEASRGKMLSAAKSAAMSASGVATPIKYYVDGKALFAEAMKPGSQPVRYAAMLDYLMKGGGRLEMPHEFRVGAMEGFSKAFRQMDARGMALNSPLAIAEATMAPLMREAVPKMKLGAFMDMMSAEIDRMGPGASIETQRASAARIWDSVENRFGELAYDNLFFDNYFKDMLHLTTMAPGWNIGSAREGIGAVKDVLTTRSRMKAGGPALTERTAFAFSLAVGTGYLGYIYNKLHGRNPKTLEDLYFPIGPDGKRVQLPTYARDVHGMATDPLTTVGNKIHPGLTLMWELVHGKDYYGRPNRSNPAELAKYLRKQIVPISMKTQKDETELDAFKKAFTTQSGRERAMGITPVSGQGLKKKSSRSESYSGTGGY